MAAVSLKVESVDVRIALQDYSILYPREVNQKYV